MRLSSGELASAEEMQRFVSAYEKRGNPARMLIWCVIPLLPQVAESRDHLSRFVYLAAIVLQLAVMALYAWICRRRYRREKPIVTLLERSCPDQLSWVELRRTEVNVEKHLAELRRLESEIVR
jgi:hypothetical protein